MDPNRYGEQSHTPFRSRRFYSMNGQFYFDTREGKQYGPYREQSVAAKALAVFVAQCLSDPNVDRPDDNTLNPGEQDDIEFMVEELLEFFRYRNNNGKIAAVAWANNRLKELVLTSRDVSDRKQRILAIEYAMDQIAASRYVGL